jgi:hypothetical protein
MCAELLICVVHIQSSIYFLLPIYVLWNGSKCSACLSIIFQFNFFLVAYMSLYYVGGFEGCTLSLCF